MFAGLIAIYLNGAMVDVDVLGTADSMAECKQISENTLEKAQPKISKDYEIVFKCFPEDKIPKTEAEFNAAPIAAAGFGTGK